MKRRHWTILGATLIALLAVALALSAAPVFRASAADSGLVRASLAARRLGRFNLSRFNLSRYLHNHSRVVYALGLIVSAAALVLNRRGNMALLAAYLLFIAYMTILYRTRGRHRMNLELFWSYRLFFQSAGMRREILYNIWLFIPLGTILYRLLERPWAILLPALLSVLVELTQYAFAIGLCELDDIVSNGLGGAIGFLLGLAAAKLFHRKKEV